MTRTKEEILDGMPITEFLLKCKTDFKFFCERCLGVTTYGGIHDFQLKWFDLAIKYKMLVLEAPAGFSKSQVMGAMYPLWLMLNQTNLKILLVSKTMEQSKSNLLYRIKEYIQDNELLMEIFTPDDYKVTWNQSEIKTKRGHWIKNVPYNENIRGYRAHFIFLDEVDSYDDPNIFFEHVTSRLYPGGTMILMSTPVGPTKLIGLLKERKKAGLLNGQFHFEKTTALVDKEGNSPKIENQEDIKKYKSIWPEMWTVETLWEKWGVQEKSNWMRNYMCECLGEIDDAIFPIEHILKAFDYNLGFTDKVEEGAMYFIAADFAISEGPRADYDAYTVLKKKGDFMWIVKIEMYKGLDTSLKIERLVQLYNTYLCELGTFLIVDPSMVGIDVMRGLQVKGIPVIPSTFAPEARKKLYRTLSNVLASRKLKIPRYVGGDDGSVELSEKLKDQLIGFRRSKSPSNNDIIESTAAHDDLAASLAMAVNEALLHDQMDLVPLSG